MRNKASTPSDTTISSRRRQPSGSTLSSTSDSPQLGDSWCPVDGSDSETDDDALSSVTLGSSHDGSSTGTRRDHEEEGSQGGSTADELDAIARSPSPLSASSLLGGESYIDAESPSTHLGLHGSVNDLGRGVDSVTSSQMPLIYPYADVENSFSSSTTVSDSTPNASIGQLAPSPVTAMRTSKHRLEARKMNTGSATSEAVTPLYGASFWSPPLPTHELPNTTGYQPLSSIDQLPSPFMADVAAGSTDSEPQMKIAESTSSLCLEQALRTAKDIRHGWRVFTPPRVRREWALTLRRTLRRSMYTLATLVSVALAVAQYNGSPAPGTSSAAQQTPPPALTSTTKPFSIFDYITVPSLASPPSLSTSDSTSSPSAKSFVPDVRLIKNALSLSTKSIALAPAEVKSTDKAPRPRSQSHTAKSAGPTTHSLSLRNTDVGLTTRLSVSAMWPRSLRGGLGNPKVATSNVTTVPEDCQCSYGQIILSDIKNAWTQALSTYSYADILHYIRDQILEVVKRELRETANAAIELAGLGKNISLAAVSGASNGLDYLRGYTITGIDALRAYGFTVNSTASSQAARDTARKARSGLEALGSQSTQRSKDAVYQARAGLDHLISEAKRLYGSPGSEAVEAPAKPLSKSRQRDRLSRAWSRRHPVHGRAITKPKTRVRHVETKKAPWTQRFFRAVHDAAPAFIL